ncbi:MAG: hypothetical protein ACI841_005323, partial [Planctomycetota bacterium]
MREAESCVQISAGSPRADRCARRGATSSSAASTGFSKESRIPNSVSRDSPLSRVQLRAVLGIGTTRQANAPGGLFHRCIAQAAAGAPEDPEAESNHAAKRRTVNLSNGMGTHSRQSGTPSSLSPRNPYLMHLFLSAVLSSVPIFAPSLQQPSLASAIQPISAVTWSQDRKREEDVTHPVLVSLRDFTHRLLTRGDV